MPKSLKAKFKLYTYDLWSDAEGGMSVNDVYYQGIIEVNPKTVVANAGTPYEFVYEDVSDMALNRAVGARGLTWEGELDYTLYATDKRGNPSCELRRVHPEAK